MYSHQDDNPYLPPSSKDSSSSQVRFGFIRFVVYTAGLGGFAFVSWLLLIFFAESTEYWPGYACAPFAILLAMGLAFLLGRQSISTFRLALLFAILDTVYFVSTFAYLYFFALRLLS